MQIHLDAVGGMAGDMFAAALLDAYPEHEAGVVAAVACLIPNRCRLLEHNDGVLAGHRFCVDEQAAANGHAHAHTHGHEHQAHRQWSDIEVSLLRSDLAAPVREHALGIFRQLARAEAAVHGIEVADVAFHEVGAWDSIADIVAAAYLVATLDVERWTIGALPLGSGRVKTAHGLLPVPAPATAYLLHGFAMIDDGIPGERITPTGAAILAHLCGGGPARETAVPRTLGRSGVGFGTKTLPGISNCVRVLIFDEAAEARAAPGGHRELAVIEFEVDDQSAEDLAMGLDRLRAHEHVFDVVQMPVFGKKGRMMTHVRALARAGAAEAAIEACFRETTTIGLRHHIVSGVALAREAMTVEVAGHTMRVKTVERPGGRTAKAEADDSLAHETHAARAVLRREAERLALTKGDTA